MNVTPDIVTSPARLSVIVPVVPMVNVPPPVNGVVAVPAGAVSGSDNAPAPPTKPMVNVLAGAIVNTPASPKVTVPPTPFAVQLRCKASGPVTVDAPVVEVSVPVPDKVPPVD